jgi:hypothetical protein
MKMNGNNNNNNLSGLVLLEYSGFWYYNVSIAEQIHLLPLSKKVL